jgi:hypothetical protein
MTQSTKNEEGKPFVGPRMSWEEQVNRDMEMKGRTEII